MDERDDAILPSSGYHVKMSQEVSGLGGDVFFGKTDLQSSFYLPLPAGWVRVPPLSQPIPSISTSLCPQAGLGCPPLSQPIPSLSTSLCPQAVLGCPPLSQPIPSLSLHSISPSVSLTCTSCPGVLFVTLGRCSASL